LHLLGVSAALVGVEVLGDEGEGGDLAHGAAVPFAPFLILGALTALFYGQALVDWYLGKLGL
jgi:leader peptidase (prepilin peptidase)/N-methyltransferase